MRNGRAHGFNRGRVVQTDRMTERLGFKKLPHLGRYRRELRRIFDFLRNPAGIETDHFLAHVTNTSQTADAAREVLM